MSSRKRRANDDMEDTRGSKRQSRSSKFGDGQGVAGLECYFYFKDGHCYWRDSCKYSHVETGRRAAPPVRDGFGSTAGRNARRPDRDKVYTQWQGVDEPQVRSQSPPSTMQIQNASDNSTLESSVAVKPSSFQIKGRATTEQSSSACSSASQSQSQSNSPAAARSSIKKKVTVNWPAGHPGAPPNASATPPALPPRSLDRPQYNEQPVLQQVSSLRPNIQAGPDVRSSVQVDYQVATPVTPQPSTFAPENDHQAVSAAQASHPQYSYYDSQASGAVYFDPSTGFAYQAPLQQGVVNNGNGEAAHPQPPHNGAMAPQYAFPPRGYNQQGAPATIATIPVIYAPPHAYQNLPVSSSYSYPQQDLTSQGQYPGYPQQQYSEQLSAYLAPLQIQHQHQGQIPYPPHTEQQQHQQQYRYAHPPQHYPPAHSISTTLPPSSGATTNITHLLSQPQPRPQSIYELPGSVPFFPQSSTMAPSDESTLAYQRSQVQAPLGVPRTESPTFKPIPVLTPSAISIPTNRERYERINATSAPTSRSVSTSPPKMDMNVGLGLGLSSGMGSGSETSPKKDDREKPSARSRIEVRGQTQVQSAAITSATSTTNTNPTSITTQATSTSASTSTRPLLPFTTLPRLPLTCLPATAHPSERAQFSRQLSNELGQHIRWLEGISTVGKRLIALDRVDGGKQTAALGKQVDDIEWAVTKLGATLRGWRRGVERDEREMEGMEMEKKREEEREGKENVRMKRETDESDEGESKAFL